MYNHHDVVKGASIRVRVDDQPVLQCSDVLPLGVCVFQGLVCAIRYSCPLVSLTARIAVIIGDVLVLLVTWYKTAQSYRESRRLGIKAPLATLMFRDGERELMIAYLSTSSTMSSGTSYFV